MDKLISLQAAIETVEFGITYAKAIDTKTGEVRELFKESNEELRKAVERIKALPSVQPERKTGHWIPVTNGRGGHQCDRCGCYAPSYQSGAEWLSNFCPECNADMRGETNG